MEEKIIDYILSTLSNRYGSIAGIVGNFYKLSYDGNDGYHRNLYRELCRVYLENDKPDTIRTLCELLDLKCRKGDGCYYLHPRVRSGLKLINPVVVNKGDWVRQGRRKKRAA